VARFAREGVQNCREVKERHKDHNVDEVAVEDEENVVQGLFSGAWGVAAVDPGAGVVPRKRRKEHEEHLGTIHHDEAREGLLFQLVDGGTRYRWQFLSGILKWRHWDYPRFHIVHHVPLLVDGLTQNKEVVLIGSDQKRAHFTVAIHVPSEVLRLNTEVPILEHEFERCKPVELAAVKVCVAIFNQVSNFRSIASIISFCGRIEDLFNNIFKDTFWNHDQGWARV